MGKSKKTFIRNIKRKAGRAAEKIKAAVKDFFIKVNPGP